MLPNAEQQQIIDSVREFFASEFPLERLQARNRAGEDDVVGKWRTIGELGYFGLGLAESQGGFGYTLPEEVLLFREAGRFLVTPSLLAQVIGTRIALSAGLDVRHLLSGAERIALLSPIGSTQIGATVSGDFHLLDGEGADWFVTWNDDGAALLAAGSISARTGVACLDGSVALARARLTGVRAHGFVASDADPLASRAVLYLAAQLVGIAEATRDAAVDYAKVRKQFDQTIGAFQAIKHKCADMAIRCESAWCQTVYAALAHVTGDLDGQQLAAAALLLALSAANENAAANVQVHGGMGYTAECNAHHFVKRARVLERLTGGIREQRRAILGARALA